MDGTRPRGRTLIGGRAKHQFTPKEACDTRPPESCPAVGSSPRTPEPAESGWAPITELTTMDIFLHSPFGNMLNSLKSLSLSGDSWPNYVRLE